MSGLARAIGPRVIDEQAPLGSAAVDSQLPVTVVIPAFRRPDMVERAIRSVRAQRLAPAEILVVDDCSEDDTGARASSFGARVIAHEQNQGEGAARNTGLRAATHDWVALLDCDDQWLPGHLETLWPVRDGHLLVGGAVLTVGAGVPRRIYGWAGRKPRILREPPDVATPENKLATSAVLLRRQAALAAGGFRADLPLAEDLDLWLRLLEVGSALAVPRVTALYHVHAGQLSVDPARMLAAKLAVIEGHAERPWYTTGLRRRHEGILAWDGARAAHAAGASPIRTTLGLARRLASLPRMRGVLELLAARWRARRFASRLAADGTPSVAILPGVERTRTPMNGAVDLREQPFVGALMALLRRPVGLAHVSSVPAALAVRAIGIHPIRASGRQRSPEQNPGS